MMRSVGRFAAALAMSIGLAAIPATASAAPIVPAGECTLVIVCKPPQPRQVHPDPAPSGKDWRGCAMWGLGATALTGGTPLGWLVAAGGCLDGFAG